MGETTYWSSKKLYNLGVNVSSSFFLVYNFYYIILIKSKVRVCLVIVL